jgi:hypothetical protein
MTTGNKLEITDSGGKNIWLALIVFWAACKAVEATFKLPEFDRNWRRVGDVREPAVSMTVPPPPSPRPADVSAPPSSEPEKPTDDQPKIKKRSPVVLGLGTCLILAVGSVVGHFAVQLLKVWEAESMLLNLESNVRPTLPKRIDKHTTLVGISHEGRRLRWAYVVDRDLNEVVRATGPSVLKTAMLQKLCPDVRKLSEYDLTYELSYRYKPSMEGVPPPPSGFVVVEPEVAVFSITKADCLAVAPQTGLQTQKA